MLGRGVGIAFLVPFLVFLAMRAIPRGMIPQLAGVFVLGGAQGVLGWYMVMSGLVDEPRVSQYRLAAHLSLAVAIYVYLLALALRVLEPHGRKRDIANDRGPAGWLTLAAAVSVFATLVMGAFVAGMKAGYLYPTFPKMGGYWVPPGMFETSPWWRNFFENPVTAQFTHRVLAFASCVVVLAAWGREPRVRRVPPGPPLGTCEPRRRRRAGRARRCHGAAPRAGSSGLRPPGGCDGAVDVSGGVVSRHTTAETCPRIIDRARVAVELVPASDETP